MIYIKKIFFFLLSLLLFNCPIVYADDLTDVEGIPVVFLPIDINYSKDVTINPKYIIIHDTGNRDAGANARNNRSYFANTPTAKASTQFVVDDSEIIQVLPETAMAWHIGDGIQQTDASNSNSIGIELCVNSDGNFGETFQNGIKLTRYLMKKYNIAPDHVIRHFDATKKICPRIMIEDDPSLWTRFKESITYSEEDTITQEIENNSIKKNEVPKESIYDKLLKEELSKKERYIIPANANARIIDMDVPVKLQPSDDVEVSNYIQQGTLVEVSNTIGNTYCKIKFNNHEAYIPYENVCLLPDYKYNKKGEVVYSHNIAKLLTKIFSFGLIQDQTSGYGNG